MTEGIGNHILTICEILGIVNRGNLLYRCLLNGWGSIIANDGSWLKELGNVAENICQFLNAVKEKNKIPSTPKSEEE